MPGMTAFERKRRAPADDAIEVMARGSRETRMKVRRRNLRRDDGSGRRSEMMIERIANFFSGEQLLEVEMGDLTERMHARVGAARAGDRHALAGHLENRLFDCGLHGGTILLSLPAHEGPAVI